MFHSAKKKARLSDDIDMTDIMSVLDQIIDKELTFITHSLAVSANIPRFNSTAVKWKDFGNPHSR